MSYAACLIVFQFMPFKKPLNAPTAVLSFSLSASKRSFISLMLLSHSSNGISLNGPASTPLPPEPPLSPFNLFISSKPRIVALRSFCFFAAPPTSSPYFFASLMAFVHIEAPVRKANN